MYVDALITIMRQLKIFGLVELSRLLKALHSHNLYTFSSERNFLPRREICVDQNR